MAVPIRDIEKHLVKVVRKYIGSKLSIIGEGVNAKPAVIRSRIYSQGAKAVTPTFPDYPYASVDYNRIADDGSEIPTRYFDEDENYVYETHKLASYTIKFFGTSKDDVMQIADEMHMLFEVDQVRDMVSEVPKAELSLRTKTDVVFTPTAMEDKYREVASFNVILAVLDQVVVPADPTSASLDNYNSIVNDSTSSYIETVVIDTTVPLEGTVGGLYGADEDTPKLHIGVDTK